MISTEKQYSTSKGDRLGLYRSREQSVILEETCGLIDGTNNVESTAGYNMA